MHNINKQYPIHFTVLTWQNRMMMIHQKFHQLVQLGGLGWQYWMADTLR